MVTYYAYNPLSTQQVTESLQVADGKVQLRHIPKQGSINIDGFVETDSVFVAANQFRCDYSLDSIYRDSNRLVLFNTTHNGQILTINYIAVGTVFTAQDANEIKAHLENANIHSSYQLPTASVITKGGVKIGDGLSMSGETLNIKTATANEIGGVKIGSGLSMNGESLTADSYSLPTASASVKGGVKIGSGLSMSGETLNCTIGGGSASVSVATYSRAGIVKPGWGLTVENDGTLSVANWLTDKVTFLGRTDYLGTGDGHGELVFYTPEQRFYIWDAENEEWLPFNLGGGAGTKTLTGPTLGGDETALWGWIVNGDGDAIIKIPAYLYDNDSLTIHDDTDNRTLVKAPNDTTTWGQGYDWSFHHDKIFTLSIYPSSPHTITLSWS